MADPVEALKKARTISPGQASDPYEGRATWVDLMMEGLRGAIGTSTDAIPGTSAGKAYGIGMLATAGVPALAGLKKFKFWHDIPELELIAGGSGPIRMYHGTTADAAAKIAREGIKLPSSGESVARHIASRYGIPFPQWQRDVPFMGYGEEVSRLSTAPYPVAARWAQHFPQGEVGSTANAYARVLAEANRRGIPFDQAYEEIFKLGSRRGGRGMYELPTAAGLPDLMRPEMPGGAVLGIGTDVRALPTRTKKSAENLLKYIESGEVSPLDALKEWNLQYRDVKLAPQNIKDIEIVSKFPRRK